MESKLKHWQKIAICLGIYDVISINFAYLVALWARFDFKRGEIPESMIHIWIKFVPYYTVFTIAVFITFKLYRGMWRFASYSEFIRITIATAMTCVAYTICLVNYGAQMPISYYVFGSLFQWMLIFIGRFSYRFYLSINYRHEQKIKGVQKKVMIVGAGSAGKTILKEINANRYSDKRVMCIIDDNSNKWNRYIDGTPIVGGRDDIMNNVKKYKIDEIYVAIPGAVREARRDILNVCKETGCKIKNLPGIYQLVNGEVSVSALREVKIEDLLGRDPIHVDMNEIFDYLKGKVIMVTGAGGSIGSELSRQIAAHDPKMLILFDVYENSVYDVEQELKDKYKDLNMKVIIGSIRDSRRMNQVFSEYRPQVVYHAAAHKHVPLMEGSPNEAIKNNVIGTYKTAYAAATNGCERFVLISTDKAVNPTNIMGASKRLCEMVVQTFNTVIKNGDFNKLPLLYTHEGFEKKEIKNQPKTDFVAVRFGNVLGSNGSVIPLFKKQISAGGPVTVTHPDIIRYFMTIPEAVSLVLQAGTYAKGGEIFVLDMGVPVKIDTLARNLIKLSGYKPDEDIDIVYTGLRPGEKLFEEKLMAEEGMRRTPNELIQIGKPIDINTDKFINDLGILMNSSYKNSEKIVSIVENIVPTFHAAGEKGTEQKGKAYEELVESMRSN